MRKVVKEDYIVYFKEDNYSYHREDGPALEYIAGPWKGYKYWYINDKRHREDGPAVEGFDGKQYWFDGVRYSFEEWQQIVKLKAFL